jgi:carbon-monoxide dehydrogenase iron sulfur subunit
MPRLMLDSELCTGCKCCELICAFTRYQVNNPRKARIRISPDEQGVRFQAAVCVQCPKPKCVEACPEGALSVNEEGIVVLDEERCDNCLACLEACPFGSIFFHPETGILKCDLCGACIPNCPNGALSIKK